MKKAGFFWIGYADLMTSLFFIMLVLYVVSFALYKKQIDKIDVLTATLENTIKELSISAEKAKILEAVEKNLEPLKSDTSLFRYEEKYKRFTLAFDVKFKTNKAEIKLDELEDFETTSNKIRNVGIKLQKTIDYLATKKVQDSTMRNVSYLVIISGYASKLIDPKEKNDYVLSYNRAYCLWSYWKKLGIDFEDEKYKGLIDLQISGNGWGGVGRFKRDLKEDFKNESKNQRFIIQVLPKIGKAI